MKKWIGIVSGLLLFSVLHSTPHLALRTKVFFMGYPAVAFTTGIVNYEYEKEVNGGASSSLNGETYTLTEPPVEKSTQGELRNYLVKKVGFLYFAEYFGEG